VAANRVFPLHLTLFAAPPNITRLSHTRTSESSAVVQAAEWLAEARSVVALTGAGVSAESGLPTFRGPEGLWRNRRPETLATPEAFAADPKTVWEWYNWRRSVHAGCSPNSGHRALAEIERAKADFCLISQNVDDLHEQAGSRRILKLHGDLWKVRCLACGKEERDTRVPIEPLPPYCFCGGMLRPAVVWSGESITDETLRAAFDAASRADLVLVLGTSSVVYPAAAIPRAALEHGAHLIEINLEPTELSNSAHLSLRGKTGELLLEIVRRALGGSL